jgi:tripartite-type tricarboxylate transporter receptor subunit TctC
MPEEARREGHMFGTSTTRALVIAAALAGASGTRAQTVEDFYRGRQINMIIYTDNNSSYDFYARLLGAHMTRHMPGNPKFIPRNMIGAGGLKASEYLYKIAPKDGATIGTVGRGLAFDQFLGRNEMGLDFTKFVWIGSMNRESTLAMSWHTSRVKTYEDLQKTELLVPGTGAGADSELIPVALNYLAGTKFKIIKGYKNTHDAALAMERGELEGIAYWSWSALRATQQHWLREKKLHLLFHTGDREHPELPGIRLIRNLVTEPTNKAALDFILAREILGRPFMAPPDIPADRAKALREAFARTLVDREFLAEAEKRQIEINLVAGEEVDSVLKRAASASPEVIARVKQALGL